MSKPRKKVLCVGLCCLDVVMYCNSFPLEDSDERCMYHKWQRGGNASNNCTIFAEFDFPCEMLGTLSHDLGGQFMKKNFEEHGICIENCRYFEAYESPVSSIWVNVLNGSRTIVHSHKDMPEVTLEDFKLLNLNNYSWIHFECRPYWDEMARMINYIREWNSGDFRNPIKISVELEKPRPELTKVLHYGDIVFISKDFASACGHSNMMSAVEAFSSKIRPDATIICAWAEKGACAKTANGPIYFSEAYPPKEVISTLGAGDTFVAAIIMALCKGKNLEDALNIGCRIAGAKCGMSGTKGLARLVNIPNF